MQQVSIIIFWCSYRSYKFSDITCTASALLKVTIYAWNVRVVGISLYAVSLVQSYLTGRLQAVQIDGFLPISAGLPQGSVFGSSFFSIFMNDLPRVKKHKTLHLLMISSGTNSCMDLCL